jgi:anthranilate synthase/aminodeoxychorismate synthase-like glutamine amidotransferase
MILLIDNYDSFVWNLARYVAELGHQRLVLRNDAVGLADIADLAPTHIILSPGPCGPAEAGISMRVIEHFGPSLPILGVCLGHQCIGAAYGGKVARAKRPMHGKTSAVTHDGSGVFARLVSPLTVTRYHSLIVLDEELPEDLTVTARSPEGEIMGLRHRRHRVEGVQFHPEAVLTEGGHAMLKNFLSV